MPTTTTPTPALRITYGDQHRTTTVEEALFLKDDVGHGHYALRVETDFTNAGIPCVSLDVNYSCTFAGGAPNNGQARIDLPGGEEGIRAFIELIVRGMKRAREAGGLAVLDSPLDAEVQ